MGPKTQWASNERDKPILPPEDLKYIQKVVGNFLYNEISVDTTIILALGTFTVEHSKGTEDTKQSLDHLLDYCATKLDVKLIFHSREMTLRTHSAAAYLS